MSTILVVYDNYEPSVQIPEMFFEKFMAITGTQVHFASSDEINIELLNKCDALLEIRPQSMFLARLEKVIRKSNRLTAVLYDDDFLAIRDFHARRRIQERAIVTVLKNTNILLSTNILLIEKYARIGNISRCVKMDTAVDDSEIKPVASLPEYTLAQKKNKVVYYCNDGSVDTFERTIGKYIPSIISEYGDAFEWVIIGASPKIDKCVDARNIKLIPHLSMGAFRKELRNGNYSFGIAPLMDDEFSKHKYINKFMEFSTAGIPCIYSRVSPYREFVVDGVDGVLCDNDASSWVKGFGDMLDINNRHAIICNAQKRIIDEFSVEGIASKLVEDIPEFRSTYTGEGKKRITKAVLYFAKVEKVFFAYLDPCYRAYGRLRIEGLKSLFRYSFSRIIRK